MLHPQRVQLRAVVDTAADLDAVGVDGPPGRGEQLDVVIGRQGQRHIAGGLGQGGVLLVGGEGPARVQRVTEPVVGPVLPFRDEPLVEQVLQLRQ